MEKTHKNESYSFLSELNHLQSKPVNKLPKILGWVLLCAAITVGIPEGIFLYKKHETKKLEKKYDRYEAVGGRYYSGLIVGYVFDNPKDRNIQYIELLSSDAPIYLNHPRIKETSLRTRADVLEMNREIFSAIEDPEKSFLEVEVTHYLNKTTKDRINVMVSAKMIPPVLAPKMDMDSERTVFRHPDTFEVIPKYYYDDIMAQRKERSDFVEEFQDLLSKKPDDLSKYTKDFFVK